MKPADVRARTDDELTEQLDTLGRESFNLRFQRANGQLENTSRVRQVRRDIAGLGSRQVQLRRGPMLRGLQVLVDLNAIFIVQQDQGNDEIGSGVAALATRAMAITASRVVQLLAPVHRVPRVHFESPAPAATTLLGAGNRQQKR